MPYFDSHTHKNTGGEIQAIERLTSFVLALLCNNLVSKPKPYLSPRANKSHWTSNEQIMFLFALRMNKQFHHLFHLIFSASMNTQCHFSIRRTFLRCSRNTNTSFHAKWWWRVPPSTEEIKLKNTKWRSSIYFIIQRQNVCIIRWYRTTFYIEEMEIHGTNAPTKHVPL